MWNNEILENHNQYGAETAFGSRRVVGMTLFQRIVRAPTSLVYWVLSVPIYIKIMGIGALVATIFATATAFYAKPRIAETLYALHENRVRASTVSLASMLERPVMREDHFMIRQHLMNTKLAFPDVLYGVVYDGEGHPIVHTFAGELPYWFRQGSNHSTASHRRLNSDDGPMIYDVTEPILGGEAGFLRIGTSDSLVARQLNELSDSVLVVLAVCILLGQVLALLLATVLTQPLRTLLAAVNSIRDGHFEHRAELMWGDEVGDLTIAFNQMAAGLESYRTRVQGEEEARRILIKRLVQAQEDERRGIALELHDELGQSLMAVLLSIHGMRRSGQLSKYGAEVLEKQLRWITDEVRGIARRMRPSILDHGGLDVALESYIEETAVRSNISIDYQRIGEDNLERLPNEVEVTLYRIAQESLTNVLRHSSANQASIIYTRLDNEASIIVEDDGVGFEPSCLEERHSCGGLGLMGMRERATLLGGQISIQSSPGLGTTVRVKIPTNTGRQV